MNIITLLPVALTLVFLPLSLGTSSDLDAVVVVKLILPLLCCINFVWFNFVGISTW